MISKYSDHLSPFFLFSFFVDKRSSSVTHEEIFTVTFDPRESSFEGKFCINAYENNNNNNNSYNNNT